MNQQTAAESEVPSVVENYFVELESDNGLLLKPSLPFPGEVRATQNVYPDKIEVTWRAVSLPASADSVTYSVYRKNSRRADRMQMDGRRLCFADSFRTRSSFRTDGTDGTDGTGNAFRRR